MTGNHAEPAFWLPAGAGYVGCQLVQTFCSGLPSSSVRCDVLWRRRLNGVRNNGTEIVRATSARSALLEAFRDYQPCWPFHRARPPNIRPEANQEINFKAAVELASLRKRKAFVGSSRRRLALSMMSAPDTLKKISCIPKIFPVQHFALIRSLSAKLKRRFWPWRMRALTPVVLRKDSVYATPE